MFPFHIGNEGEFEVFSCAIENFTIILKWTENAKISMRSCISYEQLQCKALKFKKLNQIVCTCITNLVI